MCNDGGEIYIFIFDTLSMVVIIGMCDLSVEVELYIYIRYMVHGCPYQCVWLLCMEVS